MAGTPSFFHSFDDDDGRWGANRVPGSFSPDLGDLPQGTVVSAGETWNFQLWYRDVNPTQTSNTSNGLAVTFE